MMPSYLPGLNERAPDETHDKRASPGHRKVMPGHPNTVSIREWITGKHWENLAGREPQEPDEINVTADACFDMVETHPVEVGILLCKHSVANAVADRLAMSTQNGQPVSNPIALAVARALLQAGHRMSNDDNRPWPACVSVLLQERRQAEREYSKHMAEKHSNFFQKEYSKYLEKNRRLKLFQDSPEADSWQRPFLYRKVPIENRNKELGPENEKLTCLHLSEAFDSGPKDFLKEMRKTEPDLSSYNFGKLRKRYVDKSVSRAQCSVHFTPDNFGKVLLLASILAPSDKACIFAMEYALATPEAFGHVMRVVIKKKGDKDPMALKVAVYDPNVTGNMMHVRVLPERLESLRYRDFCVGEAEEGAKVLSMEVGDAGVARAMAGKFLTTGVDVQIGSLLNALAAGNMHEMRAAAAVLRGNDLSGLKDRLPEVGCAMNLALQEGFHEAIHAFAELPQLEKLDAVVIEAIWSAKNRHNVPGLLRALHRGQAASIRAFSGLLRKTAKYMNHELSWFERLKVALHPALVNNQSDAINALGELIKIVRPKLKASTLQAMLAAKDDRGNPSLHEAVEKEHFDAVAAYSRLVKAALEAPCLEKNRASKKAISDFLFARPFKEQPISLALEKNHGDCILAFGSMLQAFQLPNRKLFNLFAAEYALKRAIEAEKSNAIKAYMESVVSLQNDAESQLRGPLAFKLLQEIRDAHGERGPWYRLCIWSNTAQYKQLVKKNLDLHEQFKLAKKSLSRPPLRERTVTPV